MEQIFRSAIDIASGNPGMMYISFFAAIAAIVGGVILYRKRNVVKNMRWPGITMIVIGCTSLVTTTIQYTLW